MSLKARVNEDMKTALRGGEKLRLSTIRMLMAAIKQREVDDRREMSDGEFIAASCRRSCCVAKAVDKVLTNIPWEDRNSPGAELRITRSPVNPTEARNVMNRLILACERQCAPPLNVRSMEGVRQLVQVGLHRR